MCKKCSPTVLRSVGGGGQGYSVDLPSVTCPAEGSSELDTGLRLDLDPGLDPMMNSWILIFILEK